MDEEDTVDKTDSNCFHVASSGSMTKHSELVFQDVIHQASCDMVTNVNDLVISFSNLTFSPHLTTHTCMRNGRSFAIFYRPLTEAGVFSCHFTRQLFLHLASFSAASSHGSLPSSLVCPYFTIKHYVVLATIFL